MKKTDIISCRAVLFDMDGVLLDSSACYQRHWKHWATKHGLKLEDILRIAHGKRTIDTMRIIAPQLDLEAEAREFTRMEIEDVKGITAIAGVQSLLHSLPATRWTIVTSAGDALARSRLAAAGLPAPARMITADLVQNGKPDPQAYLLGSKLLQVSPADCVVIEDAPAGIEAGKAAGMRVIAVATTHPDSALTRADVIVPSIQSLHIQATTNPDDPFTIRVSC